jgi:hypothetical protein
MAIIAIWKFIQGSLILEPWRLTLEPKRLTLEPKRFTLEP